MKRNFTLRLEDNLREQLETIAAKEGRTLTNLITKILVDFVKSYKES